MQAESCTLRLQGRSVEDSTVAKAELEQAIADLGLTIHVQFVPWSQSRNKGETSRSLNWLVTLKVRDRPILTTDYSAGVGHCPCYRSLVSPRFGHLSIHDAELIKQETETGQTATLARKPILPDICNVVYSLASDADVLNYPTFESWAENYGYDVDSRRAEVMYRACLESALKLRAALGDEGLRKLQEASQDY